MRHRASAIAGCVLLAQLAVVGLLLRATSSGVTLLGIPLGGLCAFRRLTGWPCPTCGMTRSIVLALNGQIGAALRANFAGPVWVAAVAGIAAALLWLAWRERRVEPDWALPERRRVRLLALAQGGLFVTVLVAHWLYALLGHV